MAGKGGGAWKVAYADFVTAMMAFFLVMWLTSQNQEVKKAVADYFGDPLSVRRGTSRTPGRNGAIFDKMKTGPVPENDGVAMGGRGEYTPERAKAHLTKVMSEWLDTDPKASEYWREQAVRQRELARRASPAGATVEAIDAVATGQLARQLKDELTRDVRGAAKGLHQDLLLEVMTEVNWKQLAEDLLAQG